VKATGVIPKIWRHDCRGLNYELTHMEQTLKPLFQTQLSRSFLKASPQHCHYERVTENILAK